MYTLKIKSVSRNQILSQIEVEVSICLGAEEMETRKFGYLESVTKKEIEADLKKFIKNYNEEKKLAEKNKEHEAKEKKITQLLDSVKTIKL